jgi:hypothetical protein
VLDRQPRRAGRRALDAAHWTPELESAWRGTYQALAEAMQRGMAEGSSTPRPAL